MQNFKAEYENKRNCKLFLFERIRVKCKGNQWNETIRKEINYKNQAGMKDQKHPWRFVICNYIPLGKLKFNLSYVKLKIMNKVCNL
jgi:hypothetical protein